MLPSMKKSIKRPYGLFFHRSFHSCLAAAERTKQAGNWGRILHKAAEISLQKQLYSSIFQFEDLNFASFTLFLTQGFFEHGFKAKTEVAWESGQRGCGLSTREGVQ